MLNHQLVDCAQLNKIEFKLKYTYYIIYLKNCDIVLERNYIIFSTTSGNLVNAADFEGVARAVELEQTAVAVGAVQDRREVGVAARALLRARTHNELVLDDGQHCLTVFVLRRNVAHDLAIALRRIEPLTAL